MTTEEFEGILQEWIGTVKHPQSARRYTQMVYQPMLELLACSREGVVKLPISHTL